MGCNFTCVSTVVLKFAFDALHNSEIILEIKYPIAPSFDWLIDDPPTVHDGAKFRKKGPL